jgi:hypothetical protein
MSKTTRLHAPNSPPIIDVKAKEVPLVQSGFTVVISIELSHVQVVNGQQTVLGSTVVKAFGVGGSEWEAYSTARERGIAEFENAISAVAPAPSSLVTPGNES